MDPNIPLLILPAAFVLDFFLGDPPFLPHPIRWMGRAIAGLEPVFRRISDSLTLSGGLFAVFLISFSWGVSYFFIALGKSVHPMLGYLVEIILIYYAISSMSLEKAAMDVFDSLNENKLDDAKQKVAMIVGRDVTQLDSEGVARATVETVAENLVDGVLSPLFYAAIGGAPLAMAFKMVNTLDSMVGYKNETYKEFGKASAKIDDLFNFLPARLSVFIISAGALILSKRGRVSFNTAVKEGANHASPNAGYPEAAFAGALGIKLGGPNIYHGERVSKPYIGKSFGPVKENHIIKACDLMLLSSCLGFLVFWGARVFLF